jgi:hypothetical protein
MIDVIFAPGCHFYCEICKFIPPHQQANEVTYTRREHVSGNHFRTLVTRMKDSVHWVVFAAVPLILLTLHSQRVRRNDSSIHTRMLRLECSIELIPAQARFPPQPSRTANRPRINPASLTTNSTLASFQATHRLASLSAVYVFLPHWGGTWPECTKGHPGSSHPQSGASYRKFDSAVAEEVQGLGEAGFIFWECEFDLTSTHLLIFRPFPFCILCCSYVCCTESARERH